MKKILSVLIVAVMVLSLVPFSAMAAVDASAASGAHLSVDFIKGVGANGTTEFDKSQSTYTITEGQYASILFQGWFAYSEDPATFGYSIDGGSVVYDTGFATSWQRDDVKSVTGAAYARGYDITAPISGLGLGTHTITLYVKATSLEGYFRTVNVIINEAGAREESVPELKDTSIFASIGATFQEAVYVNGYSVSGNPGSSGNVVRNHWTPQYITGGNGLVIAVDGSNKYVTSSGFTQFFSDYRWQGGYDFTCKYAGVSTSGAVGIHLNYSKEGRAAALYEYNGTAGIGAFSALTGNTGIYVIPTSANTVTVLIYTYDYSKANSGADGDYNSYVSYISADFTLDGVDLTKLTTFSAKDSGAGKMELYFGNSKFASVKYSNDGLYGSTSSEADCPFYERYYKTASICDATGATKVSTNAALISYYKTVGFGDRNSSTLAFDDLSVSTYTAPAATITVSMPDDITVDAGATIVLPINISGDASIISMRGSISYDAALTFKGWSLGNVFNSYDTSATVVKAAGGKVDMLIFNNEISDVAASGTIAKLEFVVPANAAAGTKYTFTFTPSADDDVFCDLAENDYDAVVPDASFVATVNESAVEETPTIVLASGSDYTLDTAKDVILMSGAANYATFMSNIATSTGSGTLVLKTASGTATTSARAVGTNYTVELQFNGAVIETYSVALLGDLNADGKVNSNDSARLRADISAGNTSSYTTVMKVAGNTNNDTRNTVNSADLARLATFVSTGSWS
ncbi:MAG: hypothetical protein IKT65_05070 [Clostridia bacterium]|nr:hypothetical protein [Clostridia bacterium]